MSSNRTAGVILAALGVTVGVTSWLMLNDEPSTHAPSRMVQIMDESSSPPADVNPDAGEGAKAKAEEGQPSKTAPQHDVRLSTQPSPMAESSDIMASLSAERALDTPELNPTMAGSGADMDQEATANAVLSMIGTRGEEAGADQMGNLGGLIGAKGIQLGSGGLAASRATPDQRISGMGGTLGGLGTRGQGSGSGSFGAKTSSSGRPDVESREGYTSYGVNAQTLVERDPLSTFSIDVDTASYTIARSKLLTGQLPPEAAVRVEEFINYFPYRYADRADSAPFAVYMESAPSPWQPSHHVLRVGLQGDRIDEDARKPVRLTFLVDVSGSMSANNKLPLARKAMRHLVGNLGPEDSVAITTYAGRTEVLLQPTAADDLSVIQAAIEALQSGGGTNMDSGIQLAYQLADRAFVDGAENRVIILSDGDANVGRTSHETLLSEITGYAKRGVTLSTIGFGRGNYQDTLMEQLANKGDGNYFYIDDFTEAKKVFGEDLSGTIQTIARDVKIQVEFDPDAVMSYRLIGYENRDIADVDFRNDAVDAGEIGSGHAVTALYDVILRDGYRAHDGPLATVRLRAKPPGADTAAEEWLTAFPAADVRDELASTTDSFRLALGAGTFAEKLRGSHFAEEVTYRQIAALVEGASSGDVAIETELVSLINRAGSLAGESGLASR